MSTLFEFDDTDEPELSEQLTGVRHPTRTAYLGGIHRIVNRDDRPLAMLSRRTRYGNEPGEKQDYYRKIGGYSMPVPTIAALLDKKVKTVFVDETDNDRRLEFQTADFRDHDGPEDWKGTDQYCIPTDCAIREWSQ